MRMDTTLDNIAIIMNWCPQSRCTIVPSDLTIQNTHRCIIGVWWSSEASNRIKSKVVNVNASDEDPIESQCIAGH